MTSRRYTWTAFKESDLLKSGDHDLNRGDSFVMPHEATVTLGAIDDDNMLSGDSYTNDRSDDHSQTALINGQDVAGYDDIYIEQIWTLYGSDGKIYKLAEIEIESYNAPGAGDDFFSFVGDVPPANVTLTVGGSTNVTNHNQVNYADLSATPPKTNVAPDANDDHFTYSETEGGGTFDGNNLLANDTDANGDSLHITHVNGHAIGNGAWIALEKGMVFVSKDGRIDFDASGDFDDLDAGEQALVSFHYTVTDGNGGTDTATARLKVEGVANDNPNCIVIEAEDMHLNGFTVVHGTNASGGDLAKISHLGASGDLSTTFNGADGKYDLTIRAQDESDGQSTIMVKVNGAVVDTVILDRDNNGGGSDNGHFSDFTVQDIVLRDGDTLTLWVQSDSGEFARIDNIQLCKDGNVCPPDYGKLTFEGVTAGTVVSDQFEGVTITAQRDRNNTPENDAMIFDSNNPTGGDNDLAFNGQGNILIISEDNDSSDPDDAIGGSITFDFDNPSDLFDIKLLDIEETGGTIVLEFEDGSSRTVDIPARGDNSSQVIELNAFEVTSMTINLAGSGAVDDLCWKPGEPAPLPGALEGRVFCDENDNSLDDAEPGVAGVPVELINAAGQVVATTTTGPDGTYRFDNLEAGDYAVRFPTVVNGKVLVEQDVNGNANDADDSDADVDTGQTQPVTVVAGEVTSNVDAGVEDPGTASIGDTVWFDADKDGTLNGAETGVDGVEVKLLADTDGDGQIDDVVATTTTANGGQYLFDGLDAGDYRVMFGTSGDLVFTTAGAAADDAVNNDSDAGAGGMTDTITLSIGEAERDIDAGLIDPGTASLAGRVFCDENDNDVDDAEPGVGGVTVQLRDASGTIIRTTTTQPDGSYEFTGLDAGDYTVDFDETDVDLGGKVLVLKNQGGDDTVDSDANQNDGITDTITLAVGERVEDVDAGVEDPGTAAIEGTYFCDENDDDVQNTGEPGISGALVTLLDAAGNPTGRTTTTDANGNYAFTGLAAGTYAVLFAAEASGKTFVAQDDPDGNGDDTNDSDVNGAGVTNPITVAIGEVSRNNDAGVEDPGTASLGDKVFIDANGNGQQDAGEVGVDGVEVTLFDENGVAIDTKVTANGGMYLFDGLDAGSYSVGFEEVAGFDFTTADAGNDATDSDADEVTGRTDTVTLSIGESNLTVDAGLVAENAIPEPLDDMAMTCADETVTIDVLANDTDADGDMLTITAVDGQSIVEGGSITTSAGTIVSLIGGALVVDGEVAYAALDIGETALENISYTVDDGNGGVADANLAMTFCGDANTYASLAASFPATASYQVVSELQQSPIGPDAFSILVTGTGDARFDGVVFDSAYCLAFFDPADVSSSFGTAPVNPGDLLSGNGAESIGVFDPTQIGINGQTAADNMDLVRWIVAQDFEGTGTYTGWEVQHAIWELTDGVEADDFDIGVFPDFDGEDVDAIVQMAIDNGEGFEFGTDGQVGVIIDPNPATSNNSQPFIFAIDFEAYDCIC